MQVSMLCESNLGDSEVVGIAITGESMEKLESFEEWLSENEMKNYYVENIRVSEEYVKMEITSKKFIDGIFFNDYYYMKYQEFLLN